MAEDTKVAVDHLVTIMTKELKRRQDERVELERETKKFWDRLKKRLPEELLANLEAEPENEAHQEAFRNAMIDLINAKQNVMMNAAIFLSKKGVQL